MGIRVVLFVLALPVIGGGIALGMYIAHKMHENEREQENRYGRNRSSYASSGRRNADGNNETCGICFNQMKDCFQFNCGHKFHKECIIELPLNERRTCPLCRAGISRQRRA